MSNAASPVPTARPGQLASLDALAAIPEEEIWLAKQKSARTRRAYRLDVAHFLRTLGITSPEQLRQVDHHAVIAWERIMCEQDGAASSTVRRRLAALSSLSSSWCGTAPPAAIPWWMSSGRTSTGRRAAPSPSPRRRPASCSTRRPLGRTAHEQVDEITG